MIHIFNMEKKFECSSAFIWKLFLFFEFMKRLFFILGPIYSAIHKFLFSFYLRVFFIGEALLINTIVFTGFETNK